MNDDAVPTSRESVDTMSSAEATSADELVVLQNLDGQSKDLVKSVLECLSQPIMKNKLPRAQCNKWTKDLKR